MFFMVKIVSLVVFSGLCELHASYSYKLFLTLINYVDLFVDRQCNRWCRDVRDGLEVHVET